MCILYFSLNTAVLEYLLKVWDEHILKPKQRIFTLTRLFANYTMVEKNINSLLHHACYFKCANVTRALVKCGFDINMKWMDHPPITYAIFADDLECVRILLENNVITDNRYFDHNKGPFHYAAELHRHDIMKLLLFYDVDVRALDDQGNSVLHRAILSYRPDLPNNVILPTIDLFLSLKLDMNQRNRRGHNALQCAIAFGNEEIIKLLIERGARGETLNYKDLEVAFDRFSTNTNKLIINAGVDVNMESKYGMSLLHRAAIYKKDDLIEFLVQKGASIDAVDNKGSNAFIYSLKTMMQKMRFAYKQHKFEATHSYPAKPVMSMEKLMTTTYIHENEQNLRVLYSFYKCGFEMNGIADYDTPVYIVIKEFCWYLYLDLFLQWGSIIDFEHRLIVRAMNLHPESRVPHTVYKYVIKHMYLNEFHNVKHFTADKIPSQYMDYGLECLKEIESMKRATVFYDIPVYKMFKGNLPTFDERNYMMLEAQSDVFKDKFPIYNSVLHFGVKREKGRQKLIPKAVTALAKLLNVDENTYRPVFHRIFLNLSEFELDCLSLV